MSNKKEKRNRNAISLETKILILDRLKAGERYASVGRHFKFGESTIRAIKKNEPAIRASVISGTELNAKKASYSRGSTKERLEKMLLIWLEDLNQKRIPTNGQLIKERALRLYEQLKNSDPTISSSDHNIAEFSASTGWLTGFLKCNAFHNVKITGEIASADDDEAKSFPKKFLKIIEDGGYSPDQVFNADETGLFWKKMPSRTYIAKSEKSASGFKAAIESPSYFAVMRPGIGY